MSFCFLLKQNVYLFSDRIFCPAEEKSVVRVRHGSVLENGVIVLNGVPVGGQVDHVLDGLHGVVRVDADQVVSDCALLQCNKLVY
jgi:hypothetical protein